MHQSRDYPITPNNLPGSAQVPQVKESQVEAVLGGIAALIAEFDHADRPDRFGLVLQKLMRSRQNFLPELLVRLESQDIALAKKAALALGYLRLPQATAPLAAIAQNPEQAIFPQAMTALSHIGSPEAMQVLVKALNHPSLQIQAAAARVLGKGNLNVVPALMDALKLGQDLVKINAAHSLGQIASPLAVNLLMQMLDYPITAVRLEAAWALGQIRSPLAAEPLAELLTAADLGLQAQAVLSLKNIGNPAIRAIADRLEHSSSNTRSIAARTLGQMAIAEVIPLLGQVMQCDPNMFVRCEAALALGEIGTYEAVFYLAPMLKDSDRSLRNATVRALRQINSAEAIEVLRVANLTVTVPQYAVAPALTSYTFPKKSEGDLDQVLDDMTVIQW